jgi:ferrochelatase
VREAVLLVSHGTVDHLDDLAAFVTNVRRGHPPAPEVVAELRRRYEAIGGRSPLNATCTDVARKLEATLGLRVAWASRLWKPEVREVVGGLVAEGFTRIVLIALAQYSARVYAEHASKAVEGLGVELVSVPDWGQAPELADAFARRVVDVLSGDVGRTPGDRQSHDIGRTTVVLTAHSLPQSVILAGDGYERDVRAAADAVMGRVRARLGRDVRSAVAYQSQGMSAGPGGRPVAWLGPNLEATFDACAARGDSVVLAPIGFLADHVEILYDLDIEAKAMAEERGIALARIPSLNADDDFLDVLALVARPHFQHGSHG